MNMIIIIFKLFQKNVHLMHPPPGSISRFIILISFALMMECSFGQQTVIQNEKMEIINLTNQFYGTDPLLVNGRKYFEPHYNAKGHPYFISDQWQTGTISMDGKQFESTGLLYNLYIDRLILRASVNQNDTIYLLIDNLHLDSFTISGHHFVNNAKLPGNHKLTGYSEVIYKGSFSVIKKHNLDFIPEYANNKSTGHYSKPQHTSYILVNGKIINVTTKKMLLTYFPEHSRQIKQFIRKNKIKYSKAENHILQFLYKHCDEISKSGI